MKRSRISQSRRHRGCSFVNNFLPSYYFFKNFFKKIHRGLWGWRVGEKESKSGKREWYWCLSYSVGGWLSVLDPQPLNPQPRVWGQKDFKRNKRYKKIFVLGDPLRSISIGYVPESSPFRGITLLPPPLILGFFTTRGPVVPDPRRLTSTASTPTSIPRPQDLIRQRFRRQVEIIERHLADRIARQVGRRWVWYARMDQHHSACNHGRNLDEPSCGSMCIWKWLPSILLSSWKFSQSMQP